MAQARVTDYFAQSKKGGVVRSLRSKGQKVSGDAVESAVTAKPKTPSRSTRSSRKTTRGPSTPEPQKHVQQEFLKIIDEALSAQTETATDLRDVSNESLTASPRTPKRLAEFDVGSVLFPSTTEQHSSAKKRMRVNASQHCRASPEERTVQKTARKKLDLLTNDHKEQSIEPLANSTSQAPQQTASKESKKTVDHNANSSPVNKTNGDHKPKRTTRSKKTFTREDVAALKSKLQKLKGQSDTATNPSPAPVSALAELKARLDAAREISAKVQQKKAERVAEDAKATEAQAEPEAEERQKLPAYQRYHTLAQDVPPGLTLPYQYKVLAEMFRSTDTIVGMLFNRSETVTFAKIKQGVQDMMRKRFEESHLGQIKAVYPSAYTFRQERNIPSFSATAKRSSYQLTVEPVIQEEFNGTRPVLSASRLLERRHIFHQNLVEIVKGHHKVYLASLNPPIVVPDDKLTRWHPRFNVDEVPNIKPSDLPQPPQTEKLTSAQEVLDKARAFMTPKMEKALANMALKTAETACAKEPETSAKSIATPTETPSALKGVSQSLLERIRAKEAQKLHAAMTRNPLQEERLSMMSRLPELARILRNVFVAEKKPALIMELACNRMIASYRSPLSSDEMEKHLRLLAELTPAWLTVHPVRKDVYLKLNKTVDLNTVLDKLNQKMKEEERI
ncbi:DNA replication factor Cdt1-like isoform X1 [Sinocyclocheilus rhinocerous]|uniref:DNA replication factor Cdt1-like n=1 Tax=Sinocyclocheilus rhinocerous TaxID=307959 RepID=A0A673G9C6_9TELE|nr:PREDICTED: DNA replication factor Cdt1-like isoform X1 [Sinocyclocheilus rhinocerous]